MTKTTFVNCALRNLIDLFTTFSNFCIMTHLVICKWGLPEETDFLISYVLLCCCFSILKYYIYHRSFSSIKKKQLYLGKLCQRDLDLRYKGIWLDLKVRSARCLQPFITQIRIQPWIFLYIWYMYLLFERCITGLILVNVLHSSILCLSLHLVYHFV